MFTEFKYGWTYEYASIIRDRIFGENSLIDIDDFFPNYDFINKSLKPQKLTLLHDFIDHNISEDLSYNLRKLSSEYYPEMYEIFKLYKVNFISSEDYEEDNYESYLFNLLESNVQPRLIFEVFNLIFQDRILLKQFNISASKTIKKMKKKDFPEVLKNDGVFKRCTYWPAWLKQGLYHRDKGHCAICSKDISNIYSTGKKLAVDHIVPLNLGGTNDPTNLQLLCENCNGKKGGRKTTTSGYTLLYW